MMTLQNEIAHHDDLYYNQHAPVLTDSEYDALQSQLRSWQACFPAIMLSPFPHHPAPESNQEQINHKAFMGSLKKADSAGDIQRFLNKAGKSTVLIQPKIDGVAVELVYRLGKLISASTRGTGDTGQNITATVQFMPAIPKKIDTRFPEVVLHGELFARLDKGKKDSAYASARHFVAGQLARSEPDPQSLADIEFFPWQWINNPFERDTTAINRLSTMGFELPRHYTESVNSLKDIEKARNRYQQQADQTPFLMDGVVIKLDSRKARNKLGWNSTHPAWAIAWKFPPESAVAEVLDADFRVGRTGTVTPVLQLTTVEMEGRRIQQVSLGSINKLQEVDVAAGDKISLILKGAAIPVFSKVIFRPESRRKFSLPDSSQFDSFSCLTFSPECHQQFSARLLWFIQQLHIPVLNKPILEALMASGHLKSIQDLLELQESDLVKSGVNGSEARKVTGALSSLPKQDFSQQLQALSLPGIGKKRSKRLALRFQNWSALMAASDQDIRDAASMDIIQVQKMKRFMANKAIKPLISLLQ